MKGSVAGAQGQVTLRTVWKGGFRFLASGLRSVLKPFPGQGEEALLLRSLHLALHALSLSAFSWQSEPLGASVNVARPGPAMWTWGPLRARGQNVWRVSLVGVWSLNLWTERTVETAFSLTQGVPRSSLMSQTKCSPQLEVGQGPGIQLEGQAELGPDMPQGR